MTRLLPPLALFAFLTLHADVRSDEPIPDPDTRALRALAVNAAMQEAKEHLAQNRPKEAIAALEKQIIAINGNPTFLALLRDAYIAYIKQGSGDRLEHAKRQLKLLDPRINIDDLAAKAKTVDDVAAKPKASPAPEAATADPFQPIPPDRANSPSDAPAPAVAQAGRESCDKARLAFEKKQYAEAAGLFAKSVEAGLELNGDEKTAWSYCRLYVVSTRISKPGAPTASLTELEREAQQAMQLGGDTLKPFGQDVLATIRKRQGNAPKPSSAPLPEGRQAVETANFRVIYRDHKDKAVELAQRAEELRATAFKTWSGPAGADWNPRCDLHLHPSAADYAQSTNQSPESPGHSSIGVKGAAVSARRIDLRADDAGLLDLTLPHEVAYVVLSELFVEQPLPRWADVGMTTLSQPGSQVSRYLRAVPKLAQEKKLFKVAELLKMMDYPDPARITPFYVESVSLVEYLVKLKGPQAFALYLREAPRRGYEEALQRHYGFRDAAELQEHWLKHVQGVE